MMQPENNFKKDDIIERACIHVHKKWLEKHTNAKTTKLIENIVTFKSFILSTIIAGYFGTYFKSIIITANLTYFLNTIFGNCSFIYNDLLKYTPMHFINIENINAINYLKCINNNSSNKVFYINSEKINAYYEGTIQENQNLFYPIRYNYKTKTYQVDIAVPYKIGCKNNFKFTISTDIKLSVFVCLLGILSILNKLNIVLMSMVLLSFLIMYNLINSVRSTLNKKYRVSTLIPERKEYYMKICHETFEEIYILKNECKNSKYKILGDAEISTNILDRIYGHADNDLIEYAIEFIVNELF